MKQKNNPLSTRPTRFASRSGRGSPYPRQRRGRGRRLWFPQGFLWGAATSAYQVEGGITQNDWEAQNVLAKAGRACEHYQRFEQDFALVKKLNHNAHRLSLEWSRIEPSQQKWNEEAIHHYYHVLEYLKKHGFKTFVTLHHFTNPVWINRKGGWANPETIEHFTDYVLKIVEELHQYVDYWITINEPGIYASLSYLNGVWPPFEKSAVKAFRVYSNMLRSHNKAYEIIHAHLPEAQVGLAQNVALNEPWRKTNLGDQILVKFSDWVSIDYFFSRAKYDFIGLNYYFHNRLKLSLGKIGASAPPRGELTDKGWEIYPRGIYEVLLKLKKYNRPIYITENGIADQKDRSRGKFILDHLKFVHRSIRRGVKVQGYFYWSLLDNFEWPVKLGETGYESKFGLIKVDFASQKRTIRKSARVYAKICKSNVLPLPPTLHHGGQVSRQGRGR